MINALLLSFAASVLADCTSITSCAGSTGGWNPGNCLTIGETYCCCGDESSPPGKMCTDEDSCKTDKTPMNKTAVKVVAKPIKPAEKKKQGPEKTTMNPTHYGDPKGGCMSDEEPHTITGVTGEACVPSCSGGTPCPTDTPSGVHGLPTCLAGAYCIVKCSTDWACGPDASCKSISDFAICTYDDDKPMNTDKVAARPAIQATELNLAARKGKMCTDEDSCKTDKTPMNKTALKVAARPAIQATEQKKMISQTVKATGIPSNCWDTTVSVQHGHTTTYCCPNPGGGDIFAEGFEKSQQSGGDEYASKIIAFFNDNCDYDGQGGTWQLWGGGSLTTDNHPYKYDVGTPSSVGLALDCQNWFNDCEFQIDLSIYASSATNATAMKHSKVTESKKVANSDKASKSEVA